MTMDERSFHKYRKKIIPFTFEPCPPRHGQFNHAVVIPILAEKESLFQTLAALDSALTHHNDILIVLVLNHSAQTPVALLNDNLALLELLRRRIMPEFSALNVGVNLFWLVEFNLNPKHGVGGARKIGLDNAIEFIDTATDQPHLLFNLDADTLVEPDYFDVILQQFELHPAWVGATIEFKHQKAASENLQKAIDSYEFFLHYYRFMLQYAQSPYAIIALGSAQICRLDAYIKCGGMRPRPAGEDFYFIQALRKLGLIGHIGQTVVHPDSRLSNRVPFGTGPKLGKITLENEKISFYHPQIFEKLKLIYSTLSSLSAVSDFLELPQKLSALDPLLEAFLQEQNFAGNWQQILNNTPQNIVSLTAAFNCFFDAFKTLKFIHFCENNDPALQPIFPDQSLRQQLQAKYDLKYSDLTETS